MLALLAPFASGVGERIGAMSGLVEGLVETGAIPKRVVIIELQAITISIVFSSR